MRNEKGGYANKAWRQALAESTADESFKKARKAVLKMMRRKIKSK